MRRLLASSVGLTLAGSTLFLGTALAQDPSAAPTGLVEEPHPAHIHSGTCAELGEVVQPLRDITYPAVAGDAGEAGASPQVGASPTLTQAPEALGPTDMPDTRRAQVSVNRVNMSIAEMRRGNHAINAHESAAAIGNYIACGDIVGARGDRNLVVPLEEQNASGYRGVAFLHADGDRTVVFVTLYHDGVGVGIPVDPLPGTSFAPDASVAPLATSVPVPVASPAVSTAP